VLGPSRQQSQHGLLRHHKLAISRAVIRSRGQTARYFGRETSVWKRRSATSRWGRLLAIDVSEHWHLIEGKCTKFHEFMKCAELRLGWSRSRLISIRPEPPRGCPRSFDVLASISCGLTGRSLARRSRPLVTVRRGRMVGMGASRSHLAKHG
jgi:hypothetical protein